MINLAKKKTIPPTNALLKQIKNKEALKKKLGLKCVYCGCTNPLLLTIDHIVPKARDGPDTNKNKQVTCWICNQLKGALTDKEYKKYFATLAELKELCKIKIKNLPPQLELEFRQNHYPNYNKIGQNGTNNGNKTGK